MSFGRFVLEEGVEMELKAEMKDVIAFLDSEVPKFDCDGHGYRISSLKGVVGSEWRLLVKTQDMANSAEPAPSVGLIEMDKLDDGRVSFRIPSRDFSNDGEAISFDESGKYFTSFVFQLLEAFRSRGFIELPGQLPFPQ